MNNRTEPLSSLSGTNSLLAVECITSITRVYTCTYPMLLWSSMYTHFLGEEGLRNDIYFHTIVLLITWDKKKDMSVSARIISAYDFSFISKWIMYRYTCTCCAFKTWLQRIRPNEILPWWRAFKRISATPLAQRCQKGKEQGDWKE